MKKMKMMMKKKQNECVCSHRVHMKKNKVTRTHAFEEISRKRKKKI